MPATPTATLSPLPSSATRITDGFWAARQQLNRTVSLPHARQMLEKAGNYHDLKLAAHQTTGEYRGPVFIDSDLYKWVEALAFEIAREDTPSLRTLLGEITTLIAAAQDSDGYLNSYYQVLKPREARFSNLADDHELYCAGHLFQAAVAASPCLGDDRLLAVARRFADHIDDVFGPGRREGYCGHPEIELALVDLFRATGEPRYLVLAQLMIDRRGRNTYGRQWMPSHYWQDHKPLRDAPEVVGHAVRQLYLLCGAADLYLETGEPALLTALERLWRDLVDHKLYPTGACGVAYNSESFGDAYELPNRRAYGETCATIATIMLAWRMLLITGRREFSDTIERCLFNGFASAYGSDGKSYFYVNPMSCDQQHRRVEWFGCACCPPNVMRTLASLQQYFATTSADTLRIEQYAPASITAPLLIGAVTLHVATSYPWEGKLALTIVDSPGPWTLSLRVPGWCEKYSLKLNGKPVPARAARSGYLILKRAWRPGDTLQLDLAMPPRLIRAHPRIESAAGCAAIQRGPILYAFEQCDHPRNLDIRTVALDPRKPLKVRFNPNLLGGASVIEAAGLAPAPQDWSSHLYRPTSHLKRPRRVKLRAIPYCLWSNRAPGPMRTWLPLA